MHPEQLPGQLRIGGLTAHYPWRAAGAAVRSRICEKVARALEAQAEGRGDDRLPHHMQVVQHVVETEREANDQERGAYFHLLERALQMRRRETPQHHRLRQCRAIQFDHRHVDLATGIVALVPDSFAVEIQRHRDTRRTREILGVGVELDLDTVGKMLARRVDHHVPARHEEQPAIALEEKGSEALVADYNATIYYLPGTTGWTNLWQGSPTALWFLPNP